MKKTLSIILSLLMVLSTVTCLFTMPVSAEEAAATPEVETLPVNDLLKDAGKVKGGTITPETLYPISSKKYPTSAAYNVNGWNAVFQYEVDENGDFVLDDEGKQVIAKDENGKKIILSGQEDSYISSRVLYQFTFDVTVSEDANEGVKLYPVFHSNLTQSWPFDKFVGMRNEVGSAAAETAYNFKTNIVGQPTHADATVKETSSLTAENAAALVPGKTYTYTYLFALGGGADWINHIRIFADGLTAGTVTVGDAKIFPYEETFAANFYAKNSQAVYYMVEENGNVFTRIYGYRDIGNTAATSYTANGKLGGDLYNIMFKGGKTYKVDFDIRVTDAAGAIAAGGYSPALDFFETGALTYNEEYNAIRAEGDETVYNVSSDFTTQQREHSAPQYGYSYFWSGDKSGTKNRRVGAKVSLDYYDANGANVYHVAVAGTGQGRDAKAAVADKGWLKGVYSVGAMGQTLQEAAAAGASNNGSNQHMRYTYKDGAWTFNSAKNSYYVSAKQDATVALAIENIRGGNTYDLDNLAITTDSKTLVTQYVNNAGEAVTVNGIAHPATSSTNVFTGKTSVNVKLFESDMYTFKGWYDGDTLVSTNATDALDGEYANLKAVIIVNKQNLLTNAGGFENYAANTSLEAAYTMVNTTNYPNYTGTATDNRRFYTSLPTGDKWTGWDGNVKLSGIKDSDEGVTTAKIIADIEAAGGIIDATGWTGFTHFLNFPTVVGTSSATIHSDAGDKYGKTSVAVEPYSGTKMLRLQASTRTGYRALEGLTPGTTYTLSMYVYNPYAYYFLKDVAILDKPRYNTTGNAAEGVNRLAGYQTPYTIVTEDIHNADGTVSAANVAGIQKANADYVQKWYKVELTFKATAEVAYLAVNNQHKDFTSGHTFIDELTLVKYECNGNHLYDNFEDTDCNVCGETRVYPTAWDFENGIGENITVNGKSEIKVVDAEGQADKIGDKYLQYTSAGFDGMAFNFMYEQGYKYTISYDFKIFTYGTGEISNGIDSVLLKYDDGKYGSSNQTTAALNPGSDNIVTRYYEDGTVYEKVTCFTHAGNGENNFYGRAKNADGYIDSIASAHGPAEIWNEWQHFEIEVGSNNDYEGLVEYGIRPNDAGWVVGIDNFTVTKVAETTIDEAAEATDGTYAFNIRAKTAEKKQGLRFKSTIDLDALNLADGAKIVEYGTLASKTSDANAGYFLRREAATDMTSKGKVIAGVAYSSEDGIDVRYALDEATNTLTYTGVLTGIGVKNYDVDFNVCGYAIIETADGNRITVYDEVVTLSVYDAAQQIVEANTNADDVAVAQTVIDTYDAYVAAK